MSVIRSYTWFLLWLRTISNSEDTNRFGSYSGKNITLISVILTQFFFYFRCLLVPFHAKTASAFAYDAAEHHLPDVRLSSRLCRLVLPERRHLLHRQNRHFYPLQLRVSTISCYQGPISRDQTMADKIMYIPMMIHNFPLLWIIRLVVETFEYST